MAMSIITIILHVINLVANNSQRNIDNINDDEMRETMTDVYDPTASIILEVVGIIVALVSLLGAVRYNQYMVGLGVVWSVISSILFIVFSRIAMNAILDERDGNNFSDSDEWIDLINATAIASYVLVIVFASLWAYPSIFLIKEIRSGVMSAETYPRERRSCCCT